jgi:hypothetical protein
MRRTLIGVRNITKLPAAHEIVAATGRSVD